MLDGEAEELVDCWIEVAVVLAPSGRLAAEWHEPAATIATAAPKTTLRKPTLIRR
ncbi:MAG TPA: hypothetical protein VFH56_00810 [Acidimicrobiales bacterium]|nr:hypothetical protein [Acidimicrobiales bacterium]